MLIPVGSSASTAGTRPDDDSGDGGSGSARGDGLAVVVGVLGDSSVSWAAEAASGCGSGVVLKQAEGKEKMEKERRRCSTADEALRVTPDPRRGDGSGGRALERTATAATTALTTRNHNALELSHAGIAAIICGQPASHQLDRAPSLLLARSLLLGSAGSAWNSPKNSNFAVSLDNGGVAVADARVGEYI
jgi:hypothetical protein